MASSNQILFSLLLFEMVLFPLIASAYTIPNVKNPISDIIPNYGGTSPGAGTNQGPTSDTVSSQTQAVQSCVVGGLTGATVGAVIGAAFFGIGAIPGAIIGGLALGGAGCGIASTFFPAQGSAVLNSISSAIPVIGDFLKALVIALSYFGPLLNFLSDSATYEFQLLALAPEIGAFLFPMQAMTLIWGFYTIALYLRGSGVGG